MNYKSVCRKIGSDPVAVLYATAEPPKITLLSKASTAVVPNDCELIGPCGYRSGISYRSKVLSARVILLP